MKGKMIFLHRFVFSIFNIFYTFDYQKTNKNNLLYAYTTFQLVNKETIKYSTKKGIIST